MPGLLGWCLCLLCPMASLAGAHLPLSARRARIRHRTHQQDQQARQRTLLSRKDAEQAVERAVATTSDEEAFKGLDAIAELWMMEGQGTPSIMDAINEMRCGVCWSRPDIKNHAKCMKYLTEVCDKGEVCLEVCKKFRNMDNEKEEEEEEEKSEEEAGPDSDGDGVPDKDDAFPDNPDESKDTDGDGHGDNSDKFPEDPNEWSDMDEDGIGDNSDTDKDGDGHANENDVFPDDPKEWKDSDQDGIGDNADVDRDGDGHDNDKDAFPDDPKKWMVDTDGDGVADMDDAFPHNPKESKDSDGDGYGDNSDKFPEDNTEWSDMDEDGIGDNSDTDRDGDGHENTIDAFPNDPSKWEREGDVVATHHDAAAPQAAGPADRDKDGHDNAEDVFPDSGVDWKDSDGDGFGDSEDSFPENPGCWDKSLPCEDVGRKPVPKRPMDPAALDKEEETGLPHQGYDELSHATAYHGPLVEHNNGDTFSGDWQHEWPTPDETEAETLARICEEHPSNVWCTGSRDFAR